MSKTCIICRGTAGSGEHVFPASLGGRRINKKIYCTTHDNGYSSLVAALANQLDLFNSLLGVRPDHGNKVKSILAKDEQSGQMVELSVKGSIFTEPRLISQKPIANGTRIEMAFPDHEALKTWIDEQKANGIDIDVLEKGAKQTYFLDTVHFTRGFGGPYGLGAVAYVAQTFLAQAFPEIARSSALDEFKRYTQSKAVEAQEKNGLPSSWQGDPPVWWDFDPRLSQVPNAFEFGHRVTVGVDSSDGLIYGRISFFSTLHFSMIFGMATDVVDTKTITIDIDPMANHPPNDIQKSEQPTAVFRVCRPLSQTAGLAIAITNGDGEKMISDLMQRLSDFDLKRTAEDMHEELKKVVNLTPEERHALFSSVLEKRSQRLWNMARNSISMFKATLQGEMAQQLSPKLDALVSFDPTSSNGLSAMASRSFELAFKAMLTQMLKDHNNGKLDVQRLSDLMRDGAGVAVIFEAIIAPFIDSLRP